MPNVALSSSSKLVVAEAPDKAAAAAEISEQFASMIRMLAASRIRFRRKRFELLMLAMVSVVVALSMRTVLYDGSEAATMLQLSGLWADILPAVILLFGLCVFGISLLYQMLEKRCQNDLEGIQNALREDARRAGPSQS